MPAAAEPLHAFLTNSQRTEPGGRHGRGDHDDRERRAQPDGGERHAEPGRARVEREAAALAERADGDQARRAASPRER